MSPKTRTKSSPSGLTPEEQQELERRGFLVKKNFGIRDLLQTFLNVVAVLGLALFTWILTYALLRLLLPGNLYFLLEHLLLFLFGIPILCLIFSLIYSYARSGIKFFSKEGIISFGFIGDIPFIFRRLLFISNPIADFIKNKSTDVYIGSLVFFFCLLAIFCQMSSEKDNLIIGYLIIATTLAILILNLIKFLFQSFNPLYAFGNLGSKIQSLTPRITEESEKIEKEFSTDMNFRTLSDSFDTLAKDFSQISSYVIKLETIEQKANKGNLFDSEKYIGSLREDIVKPLTALRSFLEKKQTELQSSEQEMKKVRVRVGSSGNGGAENLELQSKRSEPLISELTENVEKLDVMIEKFGKI